MSDGYDQERTEELRDRAPHNIEAEAALLGGLMIDNRLVDSVNRLQPEHFYETIHADIFTAIRQLTSRGKLANPITLKPHFEAHEGLRQVGGPSYLAQLTGSGAAVIGAKDFSDQIIELYELRLVRELALDAVERCETAELEVSAGAIAADLEAAVAEKLVGGAVKSTMSFADAARQVYHEMEAVAAGGDPPGFLIDRFSDWNDVVGRMEPGDFILLGARPSMGKTAVGVEVALGAAMGGVGTDFLSLEMDRRKATRRAISSLIYDPPASPKYEDLVASRLNPEQWKDMFRATDAVDQAPLTISDPAVMAVEDVAPHIRKRQREFEKRGQKLQLVVLDYIGRLTSRRRFNSETELLSYISRMLKQAAKECDVVLVALAQLSRALEQRENKHPMLADLRQSGSLEQDADTVVFIYREEYYLERMEPSRSKEEKWQEWADQIRDVRDVLEIYSSKRREGALTKRMARFYTQFQAVRSGSDPNDPYAPTFL